MSDAYAWGFRVASAPEAGAGHMSRCLALAAELPASPRFYLDPGSDVWHDRIDAAGMTWCEESSPTVADALLTALESGAVRRALFDSYAVDPAAHAVAVARRFCASFVDTGEAISAHLAIRSGLAPEPPGLAGRNVGGPEFAPLSSAYAAAHSRARERRSDHGVRRLLIAFGARDSADATGATLSALADLSGRPEIVVVLGTDAPHRAAVEAAAARIGDVDVRIGVEDMIAVYGSCDLAIGAAGMSLLERMCCGLPSIVVPQSANQQSNATAAAEATAAILLKSTADRAALAHTVSAVAGDAALRQRLRHTGLNLVDGRGAARCARLLETIAAEHERAPLSV